MKNTVLSKLEDIYEDFTYNLDDKLCGLKKFNFISNSIPDYRDENIQRFYLLRYMLGYFCEYTHIYRQIINKNFLLNKYNILSIGCGCGIDFWGMKLAQSENRNKNIKVDYTGIDRVNWLYKNDLDSDAKFICNDIINMDKFPQNDYNIIMFPKSIGEFNGTTFEHLKNIIRKTNFTEDRIIVVASIRKTRNFEDVNKVNRIIEVLKNEHNYKVLDNPLEYSYFPKKSNGYDRRIGEIIEDFEYPKEICDYILNLYTECAEYKKNSGCYDSSCKNLISRNPIKTLSQVEYQIIRLERV